MQPPTSAMVSPCTKIAVVREKDPAAQMRTPPRDVYFSETSRVSNLVHLLKMTAAIRLSHDFFSIFLASKGGQETDGGPSPGWPRIGFLFQPFEDQIPQEFFDSNISGHHFSSGDSNLVAKLNQIDMILPLGPAPP